MKCKTHGRVKSFEDRCLFCFGKEMLFGWCIDCKTGFDLWKYKNQEEAGHGDCNITIINSRHNDHKALLESCYADGCLSEVRL